MLKMWLGLNGPWDDITTHKAITLNIATRLYHYYTNTTFFVLCLTMCIHMYTCSHPLSRFTFIPIPCVKSKPL